MSARRQAGFSLIELMVAVTLGLVAIGAVGSVFVYGSRGYREDDRASRMQDSLRFAMAQLTQDIEMAGFWAQVGNPQTTIAVDASATGGFTSTTCNAAWVFNIGVPIETLGNGTAAQVNAQFPCIATSDYLPGTDVVAIRRLSGWCDPTPDDNAYYLRTNGTTHTLYKETTAAAPAPTGDLCDPNPMAGATADVDVYQYVPAIWYVSPKNVLTAGGSSIPSLCRKALRGTEMERECLVEGVEDLQFEFGLDTDMDGVANHFLSFNTPPTAGQSNQIVAVRVHLRVRSIEPDYNYRNEKTITLGNAAAFTPAGTDVHYYRRTLSSVVLLRNSANRLRPFALPG